MIKKITKYREPKMKHAGKNRANQRVRRFGLLFSALAAMLLCSCAKTAPYEQTNFVMGSVMRQTIYGANGEAAAKSGYSAAADTEARISWKIPSSEISRLNENAGKAAVEISPETERLLTDALELSRRSGGAFDPAILPLSALLGATYLIWADAAARSLFGAAELPIGIITAFTGAPFFFYLMLVRNRKGSSHGA